MEATIAVVQSSLENLCALWTEIGYSAEKQAECLRILDAEVQKSKRCCILLRDDDSSGYGYCGFHI